MALNGGDAAILLGLHRGLQAAFGPEPIAVADDAWTVASESYPDLTFVPPLHGSVLRGEGRFGGMRRSLRRRRVSVGTALLFAPGAARVLMPADAAAQLAELSRVRAAISTGGTYLVEHYPLRRRLESIAVPARFGVPTYLYTQSLGPFRDPSNARRVGATLRRARKIFLRDERSRDHLLAIGLPEANLHLAPDAAFALARLPLPEAPTGGLRVAVSVRHWGHHGELPAEEGQRDYRRSIAAAVRALVEAGASVTFLSTCQGQPAYRTDDARYARRIVEEELGGVPGVRVDGTFRTPDALIDELSGYHMVIATRMHFAILALCAGVPVAPIAYEFKTTELFRSLGWGDRVVELEGITPSILGRSVDAVMASLERDRARLAERLPALKEGALAPARIIRDDLGDAV